MDAGDLDASGSGGDAGPRDGGPRGDDASLEGGTSGKGSTEAGHEVQSDSDAGAEVDEDGGRDQSCDQLARAGYEVALWLDAAQGVDADAQGRVQRWVDRSPHRHEAVSAGDDAQWPLLFAQADGTHPAVGFGVADDVGNVRRMAVLDHSSLWFGVDDFAIIVVLRYRNSTTPVGAPNEIGAIYEKQCACPGYVGPALFANDNWSQFIAGGPTQSSFTFQLAARADYAARSQTTGFNDNQVHLVIARRVGTALSIELDGQLHATGLVASSLDVSVPGVDVSIGANPLSNVQALEGELFELIAIKGSSARDLGDVVACLSAKYRLN